MLLIKHLKREWPWAVIFLVTQIIVFALNYRVIESKFFPVVENFKIEHVVSQSPENGSIVYVSFEKIRNCELVGVRMTDKLGWRVKFKFLEDDERVDDSYRSRNTGIHTTGPWWIGTDNWSNIQIEAIHKCDPFGYTVSYMQKIKVVD